jgi:hypothetical protein
MLFVGLLDPVAPILRGHASPNHCFDNRGGWSESCRLRDMPWASWRLWPGLPLIGERWPGFFNRLTWTAQTCPRVKGSHGRVVL